VDNILTIFGRPSERSAAWPRIYFAGKIAKHGWRERVCGDPCRASAYDTAFLLDPDTTVECAGFDYGGPFFVSCDHGCAHGPASHGAGLTYCTDDDITSSAVQNRRRDIWRVNRERIRLADVVFAYVDEADCFGTFIELGFAAALGKPIGAGFGLTVTPRLLDDLWMARMCHSVSPSVLRGGPEETFAAFLRSLRVS
jgi:hypothetical protein